MQILLSQMVGQEIDTSLSEMIESHSRVTGASLSESREVVKAMMTDVARGQRQAPRSKPEHTPEVASEAAEVEEHGPEKRSPDTNWGIYDSHEAIGALARMCGVSQMDAVRLLSTGDGDDLPAPRSYGQSKSRFYHADELKNWAARYRAARKQQKATDKSEEDQTTARRPIPAIKPHFPAVTQASEREDIDSVAAGRMCFGDTRPHERFRQDSEFLSDGYFRSNLLGR